MRQNGRWLVLAVYGTRPEAVKCAPIIRALRAADDFACDVVLTGQHRELVTVINAGFGVTADVDLAVFSPGQSLSDLAGKTLTRLVPVLRDSRPDAVLVQGDTTSALAAGLAGFYQQVPVIHLEAGLRTGSLASPFPEEGNRRLLTQIASIHLAATTGNRDNLLRAGVAPADVFVTGNPVIDALRMAVGARPIEDPVVAALVAGERRLVLVTAHRRESWGPAMDDIAAAVARLAVQQPDVTFIVPLHPNPVVRQSFVPVLSDYPNVALVEPLGYFDLAGLLARVTLVLTDSGGLQEEAPALGKPVLVLRQDTERPEGVAAGTAELVGHDRDLILRRTHALLRDPVEYARMAQAVNPYGDGHAADRVVEAIRTWLTAKAGPAACRQAAARYSSNASRTTVDCLTPR